MEACNFIKKRHRCFPVNIAKFLGTPIIWKNICERLLLQKHFETDSSLKIKTLSLKSIFLTFTKKMSFHGKAFRKMTSKYVVFVKNSTSTSDCLKALNLNGIIHLKDVWVSSGKSVSFSEDFAYVLHGWCSLARVTYFWINKNH